MADNSTIGWTDDTRNFWSGCAHATYHDANGRPHMHPGCLNCYAEQQVDHRSFFKLGVFKPDGTHLPIWGQGELAMRVSRKTVWSETRARNRRCEKDGTRRRQFCMSLGDIFEDFQGPVVAREGSHLCVCPRCFQQRRGQKKESEFRCRNCDEPTRPLTIADLRQQLFALIDECQNLDFLCLTKRPQIVPEMLPSAGLEVRTNMWLGVSVSNQATLEWSLRELHAQPKRWQYTFLSIEPLLERIDLKAGANNALGVGARLSSVVQWIIVGGESSQQFKARPFPVDAAKLLIQDAQEEGMAVFVKQFGDMPIVGERNGQGKTRVTDEGNRLVLSRKGEKPAEWPAWARVQQFPDRVT